jgi:hypothetical protein
VIFDVSFGSQTASWCFLADVLLWRCCWVLKVEIAIERITVRRRGRRIDCTIAASDLLLESSQSRGILFVPREIRWRVSLWTNC